MIVRYQTVVYPFKVWVSIGESDKARKDILAKFRDYETEEPLKDVPNTDVVYLVEEMEQDPHSYGVLMLFTDESRFSHKTVTHETIHATAFLLECIGDTISGNETSAYLAGWIADCCIRTKLKLTKYKSLCVNVLNAGK